MDFPREYRSFVAQVNRFRTLPGNRARTHERIEIKKRARGSQGLQAEEIIDDFSSVERASNGQRWRYFSDRVMGGVSTGRAAHDVIDGRPALHLSGEVSLENNGGFVQVALDLTPDGTTLDARRYSGIVISLRGDGGAYALNLRTSDLRYPWQSYRCAIQSTGVWQSFPCAFSDFEAHRTDRPLDRTRLRRVGLIAIGEARAVDVAIGDMRFYESTV